MPDGTELGKAQVDSTGEAAGTKTAANASLSDDQLDELFHELKTLSAGQPELRLCLVRHMLMAEEAIERLIATGLAHPSVATTLTQSQDKPGFQIYIQLLQIPEKGWGTYGQNSYAHTSRLGEKEAREILSVLKPADDMFSDALGDLIAYDNAWCWLEAYANAGGNLQN